MTTDARRPHWERPAEVDERSGMVLVLALVVLLGVLAVLVI